MTEEREFTVEEANELLPALRESLARIQESRQVVMAGAEQLSRSAPLNGGGAQGKEYWEALAVLRRELESLAGQGIALRDAETGLVDFPSRREGELVFLCWRPDEPAVGFWHSPGTGFTGRRPI